MNLEKYEQWLILKEDKKTSSANSYKSSIGRLETFYYENSGVKESFLNASTSKLKELVSIFETKDPFITFGEKSNSTNINALRALLRYKKALDNINKVAVIVNRLLKTPHFESLIENELFYFQQLTDLFEEYKSFDIKLIENEITDYLNNEPEKFNFQQLLDNSKGFFKDFILLLGKMIAVFDEKGYNKRIWNLHEDRRVVSRSMLSQRYWTFSLLEYKLSNFDEVKLQSHNNVAFKYSINFINNPENQTNIVSKNHRKEIVNFFNIENDDKIIELFSDEIFDLKNLKNKGVIISHILYNKEVKEIWLSSITALMASDSTGWFDNYITEFKKENYGIIWNSKRPSGTAATIKVLKNILKEGDTFNIYYTSGGYVNYMATVIDFVENKEEFTTSNWKENYKTIYGWQDSFSKFTDNKKSARIVFLIESLEKIKPISLEEFKTYKDYKFPTQDNLSPIQLEPDFEIIPLDKIPSSKVDIKMEKTDITPLNQILYGPPGTGKTFATKEIAVSIIDNDFIKSIDNYLSESERRKIITEKYEELYNSEQIVFTTFHQSMSYEDFVEGIKPKTIKNKVVYDIDEGIFKLISDAAKDNWEAHKNSSHTKIAFDDVFNQLKDDWEEDSSIKFPMKTQGNNFTIIGFTNKSIQFKKASGGTDHTLSIGTLRDGFYNTNKIRTTGVGIYYPPIIERLNSYNPSQEETTTLKNHVLIIDEINRGNVSAIFGELITLLEPDKRIGETEELKIKLPYSKEKFGVPSNLHIIGTMNTADRSVEALDTALRRRFEFKEIMPNSSLLKLKIEGVSLNELLETINKRIEVLLDRDHTIGHSYFIKLEENDTDGLKNAFKNNIIPLLQEYFYGDYEKIGLVLGKGFFNEEALSFDKDIFASFDTQNYPEKGKIFSLKTIDEDFDIIKAIHILLKKTTVNE